ncbi:dna methyltransferase dim-2 [Diplodia corticola]|uniref:DNA (cytosine-5-)-methyltransferase n=1 Tax=Diplodia corticola TaxID=236234 RepID=A0A1J9R9C3_9PEZI|nr:dna methyltransferase dim-2 [Diplodia corticola]OJD37144.1 dna methyltransferase dim-2 [Diplodia corticola]
MRLHTVIDAVSADTVTVKDELLDDFADVDLIAKDEDDCPLPQPKRVRFNETGSESIRSILESEGDPMVIDLTGDGENEPLDHPKLTRTPGPQAGPVPSPNPRIQVKPSLSNYPRSLYDGWQPPLAPTAERIALSELLRDYHRPMGDRYIMIPIREFRIYRPSNGKPILGNRQHELEPLHHLKIDAGCDCLLVDGIISLNGLERYIQGVPFETLAIDGYGDVKVHTVSKGISIMSTRAKDVWYLLQEPASDYTGYHGPFIWIADFAKYVVEYLDEHETVSLDQFKSDFYDWTRQRYGESQTFQKWVQRFDGEAKNYDFRQAAVAYGSFLWKEAWSILKTVRKNPFWGDINYIADNEREGEPPLNTATTSTEKTLVTPYVFENFKHIKPLIRFFETKNSMGSQVQAAHEKRKRALGFMDGAERAQKSTSCYPLLSKSGLMVGDYVAVYPEEATLWRDGSELWYAYIQHIQKDRHGQRFKVLWLYSASATTLAGGHYPFPNELFLSSHCNCNEATLMLKDIAGRVNVSLGSQIADGLSNKAPHFFIRQKFDPESHAFTTIKSSDFLCQCRTQTSAFEEILGKVPIGDPILAPFNEWGEPSCRPLDSYAFSDMISDTLEPVVVENYLQQSRTILVRRLIRRYACHEGPGADPNELVWTDDFLEIDPVLVGPKCHIRFFEEGEQIPSPYSRGGSGNCWYITRRLTSTGGLEALQQPFPIGLNQGIDPNAPPPRPKMVGLDVFAGGGNFGRGLEDGMAVEFLYAIDWAKNAVNTYRANRSERPCWVYWGSVNDYLRQVMDGSTVEHFAGIDQIDFIAAGSPCQGFSRLQRNKASDSSLRNISMVASVAAYVDVYRPRYAVLENVIRMAHQTEELGVFPQLLCTLVGLGYQISQHLLDAWSCGDPQRRSRLFVQIAAPGLAPIPPTTLTHSHPPGTANISLGKNLANGQRFGERRITPTPFRYVSVQESMGDLPDIQDSHSQTCIKNPDHRTVSTEASWTREMIRHIPIHPPLQGVVNAIHAGVMPQALAERFLKTGGMRAHRNSKSWSRISRDGLTSTITTTPAAACAITGRALHWQQHRVLSIREARRAQGFDERDIITGSPSEQWKIIGNSVSRSTALALGMALQEAWLANPLEHCPSNSFALPISPDAGSEDLTANPSNDPSPPNLLALSSNMPTPISVDSAERPQPQCRAAVVIDLTRDD